MKDKILGVFVKMFSGNVVRHGLAALGGYLSVDVSNIGSLFMGVICFGISVIWSLVEKQFPTFIEPGLKDRPESKELVKMIGMSISAQLISAVTGWLLAHGYTGSLTDTYAMGVFALNLFVSVTKPQK